MSLNIIVIAIVCARSTLPAVIVVLNVLPEPVTFPMVATLVAELEKVILFGSTLMPFLKVIVTSFSSPEVMSGSFLPPELSTGLGVIVYGATPQYT